MICGMELVAVHCPTEDEARLFMQLLADTTSVKWRGGQSPSERYLNWSQNQADTTYTIRGLTMSFGNGSYPREHGIPVLEFQEFCAMLGVAEEDTELDFSLLELI